MTSNWLILIDKKKSLYKHSRKWKKKNYKDKINYS